jgi:uncharacterized membrane protein required for colicin V production
VCYNKIGDDMNILDLIILIVLILFVVEGFKRGVIKEIVSLVGIIIVFILAFSLKGVIGNVLCYLMPFFEFGGAIKGFVTLNILIYQMIAFILVFCLLLSIYEICLRISKVIQKIVNMTIILLLPSKVLGALVSLIKGIILVYVLLLLVVVPFSNESWVKNSTLTNAIVFHTPVISYYTNSFIKPVKEIYDLGEDVADKNITINKANLKALDIMLKYKVVSKRTIERLVELDKLDEIKDINSVLKEY